LEMGLTNEHDSSEGTDNSDSDILKTFNPGYDGATNQNGKHPWHQYCIINVHGFHHSGTGMLESAIVESLTDTLQDPASASQPEKTYLKVSYFKHTGVAEDEGQHLQKVYPSVGARTHGSY